MEGVPAQEVDVLVAKGRKTGHILFANRVAFRPELGEGRVHVERVPEHNGIEHKT